MHESSLIFQSFYMPAFLPNLRLMRPLSSYDKNKKCTIPIGFRIQKHIDISNIPLDIIKPVSHSKISP